MIPIRGNKHACSVILQANEIWQCILFLYELYSGEALLTGKSIVINYREYTQKINHPAVGGMGVVPILIYRCIFKTILDTNRMFNLDNDYTAPSSPYGVTVARKLRVE